MELLVFREGAALRRDLCGRAWTVELRQRGLDRALLKYALDLSQDRKEVCPRCHEVQIVGVYGQYPGAVKASEKLVIGLPQLVDIVPIHSPLIGSVALGDPAHQDVGVGLEVDNQIGDWGLLGQCRMDLLVDLPLITCQIQAGKKPILGEHIVREESVSGEGLGHLLLLAIPAQQEEHLGLKRILGARFIELG